MTDTDDVKLTAKQIKARFGNISDMSIYRWLRDDRMGFPQPLVINGRRYWSLSDIVAWERQRAGGRAA